MNAITPPTAVNLAQPTIPLIQAASQQLNLSLSGQSVTLAIYQRSTGLYMDVTLNGVMILRGQICLNQTWIVRAPYLNMPGDLFFNDTQGDEDPTYDRLGTRFALIYVQGANINPALQLTLPAGS